MNASGALKKNSSTAPIPIVIGQFMRLGSIGGWTFCGIIRWLVARSRGIYGVAADNLALATMRRDSDAPTITPTKYPNAHRPNSPSIFGPSHAISTADVGTVASQAMKRSRLVRSLRLNRHPWPETKAASTGISQIPNMANTGAAKDELGATGYAKESGRPDQVNHDRGDHNRCRCAHC
jgi:hypothetical protein